MNWLAALLQLLGCLFLAPGCPYLSLLSLQAAQLGLIWVCLHRSIWDWRALSFFPNHFYPKEKRIFGSLNLGLLARQVTILTTRLASQANHSIYLEWTVFGNQELVAVVGLTYLLPVHLLRLCNPCYLWTVMGSWRVWISQGLLVNTYLDAISQLLVFYLNRY